MTEFFQQFNNYTFLVVTLGSAVLGLLSGVIGTFAVLRRQSLLGDAVSHAALPGIALAFILTASKQTSFLLLGALIAGLVATFFINSIIKHSKLSYDTALALVMSVMFGLGMVLLSALQQKPDSNQSGIKDYIFGQAATMLVEDVIILVIMSAVIFIFVMLFWKEFKLFAFDPEFAKSIGFSPFKLNLILSLLIVLTIVVGLQAVGVILMSAMLIAPAAAARQWSDKLYKVVLLSAVFGAFSGIVGTILSTLLGIPTGPAIVVVISIIVLISLMFAPSRGILWRIINIKKRNSRFKEELNSKEGAKNA